MLEPYEAKVSCTVLRRGGGSNLSFLFDYFTPLPVTTRRYHKVYVSAKPEGCACDSRTARVRSGAKIITVKNYAPCSLHENNSYRVRYVHCYLFSYQNVKQERIISKILAPECHFKSASICVRILIRDIIK
jgi:hypothetical protein